MKAVPKPEPSTSISHREAVFPQQVHASPVEKLGSGHASPIEKLGSGNSTLKVLVRSPCDSPKIRSPCDSPTRSNDYRRRSVELHARTNTTLRQKMIDERQRSITRIRILQGITVVVGSMLFVGLIGDTLIHGTATESYSDYICCTGQHSEDYTVASDIGAYWFGHKLPRSWLNVLRLRACFPQAASSATAARVLAKIGGGKFKCECTAVGDTPPMPVAVPSVLRAQLEELAHSE